MSGALVSVKNLVKTFSVPRAFRSPVKIHAVDGVSLSIEKGETLALVGESGSGKSTLGRAVMRLYKPDSGAVFYNGADITMLRGQALAFYRKNMQMILQDPYSALNPAMTVRDIIAEPLLLKEKLTRAECDERICAMLSEVGLSKSDMHKYPHEFSGGQRQRIGIARALITRPEFVLCDEPISALDVSIQAQVVNLLEDLQAAHGLTYLFIAHDLSMARHISRRAAVMYKGRLMETAPSEELYKKPRHPYTQMLLSSVPLPYPNRANENLFCSAAESIAWAAEQETPPQGCPFAPRCPKADLSCREQSPEPVQCGAEHFAACKNLA